MIITSKNYEEQKAKAELLLSKLEDNSNDLDQLIEQITTYEIENELPVTFESGEELFSIWIPQKLIVFAAVVVILSIVWIVFF